MDRLIEELRAALTNNQFTVVLMGSLAAIDICAALDSESGETKRSLFKQWFAENLGSRYPSLSADDVYKMRCGMLHQGRATAHQYEAIVFTLPGPIRMHNNILNDALNLDLVIFCTDVLDSITTWCSQNKLNEPINTNAQHLLRIRPDGLSPYIVGVPVIA